MTEFVKHLEFYQSYPWAGFSKLVPDSHWGKKELAEEFLKKYWLPEQQYVSIWKPIQDNIFIEGKGLPELIYRSNFEIIALRGGCLFIEEDFKQLQKSFQSIGEEQFVIIQHSQDFTEGEPMFRMKFPANITWEELTSGNYISAVLLEMSYNEYFVFGSKGNWGKYSANDYEYPLDIIGYNPKLAPVFKEIFKKSEEEQEEIQKLLSQGYKELIK
jgi:hypothetical protein